MRKRRMLYLQYTNPTAYPPIEHSSHLLAEAGWEVLFLGLDRPPYFQFPSHPRIRVEAIPDMGAGWQQKLHYLWFCCWLLGWVVRWQPGWVYASDPLSTPPALMLSYLPWLKVLYHEHDSPSSTEPMSRFMRGVLVARRYLARRVSANVLPNAKRGELFREITGTSRPIFTVWNCPAREEVPPSPIKPKTPIRLLYHGTIVPQRLPLTIIEALATIGEPFELHIGGYETQGAIGYSQTLQDHASELGVADRLHFHGAIPARADLLRHAATCHIGLAFMPLATDDINLETMAGASNKPFDYMACGLVLLVTPLPEWEQLYVDTGFGIACNPTDSNAVTNAIQWYVDHPTEREQMGMAGRAKILSDWNYEKQFQPVLSLFVGEDIA